jgi:hypothetical protein
MLRLWQLCTLNAGAAAAGDYSYHYAAVRLKQQEPMFLKNIQFVHFFV